MMSKVSAFYLRQIKPLCNQVVYVTPQDPVSFSQSKINLMRVAVAPYQKQVCRFADDGKSLRCLYAAVLVLPILKLVKLINDSLIDGIAASGCSSVKHTSVACMPEL